MSLMGRNPMKSVSTGRSSKSITLTTVVCIPEVDGFWAEALPILKLCLASMRANSGDDCDVSVFDNASCKEVRSYLLAELDAGHIQYLVLSNENVGKLAAQDYLLHAAPGRYLGYSDSDVLFLPGWIEESQKVLDQLPNVGMVSGRPWRPLGHADEILVQKNLALIKADGSLQYDVGDLVAPEVLKTHADGLGIPVPEPGPGDIRVEKNGVTAYAFGSHFQFFTSRDVVRRVGRLGATTTGCGKGERIWDDSLPEAGYLRLALDGAYVHHLGNSLRGESEDLIRAALSEDSVPVLDSPVYISRTGRMIGTMMRVPIIRKGVTRLQRAMYEGLCLYRMRKKYEKK